MKTILNKKNRNGKEDIELVDNKEKSIYEIILEKGKEKINEYMNDKFKRLNYIRQKEDEIEREKEIIIFEEELKFIDLRNELRKSRDYYEVFTKKEKIISLIEEPEGENKGDAVAQQKNNFNKRKKFN